MLVFSRTIILDWPRKRAAISSKIADTGEWKKENPDQMIGAISMKHRLNYQYFTHLILFPSLEELPSMAALAAVCREPLIRHAT